MSRFTINEVQTRVNINWGRGDAASVGEDWQKKGEVSQLALAMVVG